MKKIKYIISLIIILNICFLQGFSAFAQDDDLQNEPYYFKAYDVNITVNEEPNNIEDIYKDRKKEIEINSKKIEEDQNKEDRPKGGRHF
jgi:hypothetical protein